MLFGKWSGTEVKIDGAGPDDHEGERLLGVIEKTGTLKKAA